MALNLLLTKTVLLRDRKRRTAKKKFGPPKKQISGKPGGKILNYMYPPTHPL